MHLLSPIPRDIPDTIAVLFRQLGWGSLRGAFVLCGCDPETLRVRFPDGGSWAGEVRGSNARWDPEARQLDFTVGLQFGVNGRPGEGWQIAVAYESNDTYSVWLLGVEEGVPRPLSSVRGVYDVDVRQVVVDAYDRAIQARNGGCISLD